MDHAPSDIVIELDAGGEPISGRVRTGAQPPQPFTGWTGLFAVLRATAGEAARQDGRTDQMNRTTAGRGE
jgi:hypothetical protein